MSGEFSIILQVLRIIVFPVLAKFRVQSYPQQPARSFHISIQINKKRLGVAMFILFKTPNLSGFVFDDQESIARTRDLAEPNRMSEFQGSFMEGPQSNGLGELWNDVGHTLVQHGRVLRLFEAHQVLD